MSDDPEQGGPNPADPNLVSAQFGARAGPAHQARRVPFRVVVVGDFGLPAGRLHGFDDQEPDEALAAARPTLSLAVPDRLTGGDRPLAVALTITALRDFAPARLVEAVPELATAMAIRDKLRKGVAPQEALAEMPGLAAAETDPTPPPAAADPTPSPVAEPPTSTQRAEPPASPPPASPQSDSDDPLDRLFGMVDAGPTAAPQSPPSPPPPAADDPAKRAVSAFIGSMGGRKPARASAGDVVAEVERRIAAQIAAILEDPAFAGLERAWRGLRFLLRHTNRRAHCFVHAISAGRDEAATAARSVLIDAADDQPAGLGLLVSAFDYGAGPAETALLQALAEVGAEIQVVTVASAAAAFVHGGDGNLAAHRDPETLFQDAAYGPWSSLRAKPATRWLGLAANRVQLRGAHDLTAERRLAFATENRVGPALEAGGAWIVAALAAESAAETGWPSELTGPQRVIDGLTLYDAATEGSTVFAVALPLRPDAAGSLANAGLIALVGQANRDIARLVRVPGVHATRADPAGDLPRHGTLDYQLLVSRLIRQIEGNADLIFSAGGPDGIRAAMDAFLTGLMGPGATVRVALETDDADEQVLAIQVTTGHDILGGVTVPLDLPI